MPVLADDKLKKLIIDSQVGNNEAKEIIITENLNLVRSIVHRFANRGYEWDDLFQIGCIGLVKAIDRFDVNYNVKFSTYAVPMIIGEIRRFIRDDNPMKISRSIKELGLKIHRIQDKLIAALGREPTIKEIADELSLAPQEIVSALEALQPPASLYEQAYKDNGDPIPLLDQLKTDNDEMEGNYFDKLMLREVIKRLPHKEQMIIELRFFKDKTQCEIAEIVGLSQVQVSRIEKNALKKIRELLKAT